MPSSRFLTRFNPVPVATETIQIPIFVTVPNATSPSGGVKPAGGWPVLIFQHGLTRNRLDAVGVADAFASAGYVVVSIDLPLHGIAGADAAANPFYQAGNERTFNLDFVNNYDARRRPGRADRPLGHALRQPAGARARRATTCARARWTCSRSPARLRISISTAIAGGDIDTTPHSLPGPFARRHRRRRVSRHGRRRGSADGRAGRWPAAESRTPSWIRLRSARASCRAWRAQGITQGSTLYAQFFRDVQTIVDAGDPVNYIASAAAARPAAAVPGGGRRRSAGGSLAAGPGGRELFARSGSSMRLRSAKISTPGANAASLGYVNFIFGDHGSIIDPTASLAVTVEMQTESVAFSQSPAAPSC